MSVRKLPAETLETPETSKALKTNGTTEALETPEASTPEKLCLLNIIRRRHFTRLEVVNVQLLEFLLEIIHLLSPPVADFYLSKERGQNEEQDKNDQKRNLSSAHAETTIIHTNAPPCTPS
ncbi:hypothetical protein GCM10025857_30280 [Alicyclobacillus contaminans]|nr:hypothetical protein GCM10025857_30280 [Alicyclobacillus contaminans]